MLMLKLVTRFYVSVRVRVAIKNKLFEIRSLRLLVINSHSSHPHLTLLFKFSQMLFIFILNEGHAAPDSVSVNFVQVALTSKETCTAA